MSLAVPAPTFHLPRRRMPQHLARPNNPPAYTETYKVVNDVGEEDFPLEAVAPPQALEPSPSVAFDDEVPALIVHFHNLQANSESKESRYKIIHHRPSVRKLILAGPKECMRNLKTRSGSTLAPEKPELRWIHLPANNMSWVEKLMMRIQALEQYTNSNVEKAEVLLSPEYWINRRVESGGPATLHMRPFHSKIASSERAQSQLQSNEVLFMPYLHWDYAHKLQCRNNCIKIAVEGQPVPNRPSLDIMTQYSEETVEDVEKDHIDLKNSQADDPSSVLTRSELEAARYRRMFTIDELVMLAYLNVGSPIHPRRTLDHSRYPTLQGEDIDSRDLDQVVYRHTKRLGLKPRLIMVDQLWMWMLDDNTIVTAFPGRWKDASEPTFDRSDIVERIMMDLTSNVTKIKSCSELAHLIIRKCAGTFFPTPIEVDPTGFLDFMNFFGIAIGDVKTKETRAFNRLWEHSNEMESLQDALRLRRSYPKAVDESTYQKLFSLNRHSALSDQDVEKRIQDEVSALTNITEETNLLKEIKDILDELSSILLILKEQELVVHSMNGDDEAESDEDDETKVPSPEGTKATKKTKNRILRSHSRLLRYIRDHKRDVELLELEAIRTHDALSMLLDLKQKQASVSEADYARQEAVETTSQGRTILVFTTVTIVFLPLSFIAGIFSMNAKEINGYERPVWQIMAIMIPITLIVLAISSTLAHAGKHLHTTSLIECSRGWKSFIRSLSIRDISLTWEVVGWPFGDMWERDRPPTPRPGNRSMPVFDFVRGPVVGTGRYS